MSWEGPARIATGGIARESFGPPIAAGTLHARAVVCNVFPTLCACDGRPSDGARVSAALLGYVIIEDWRASQIRVHVLYRRPEIPANTVVPAIAVSVT